MYPVRNLNGHGRKLNLVTTKIFIPTENSSEKGSSKDKLFFTYVLLKANVQENFQ